MLRRFEINEDFLATNLFFCVGMAIQIGLQIVRVLGQRGCRGCPLFPDNLAAEIPAFKPSFRDFARSAVPLQPPYSKNVLGCFTWNKVASSWFHLTLPPLCEKRCIVDSSPRHSQQSHLNFRPPVSVFPSDDSSLSVADLIRCNPWLLLPQADWTGFSSLACLKSSL